ncbi:CaiB/BaiF CoA transferase family protein [Halobacterium jilantaiense]|uniref:Crotonobetainyl-CoA:carnitine CoA-transferase CaiB n=1 Tax=Halobacterium jilantaiense TaxID=355548 RepID=A0A1I0QUL8_9EURY|nr:CaiB/BaiF CoA-transferase family protein [Halobacterium jilantaiense]SEW31318.1 Crotonobetainyl-CoA:carnitine CoA-transferase CaiB [Halobacterium jilantaiense]
MTHDGRALDGVTVLDLSTFVTGGFCSLMLANQGAEVVKVERPDAGDDNRHSGPPFVDGESPYFWTVNYGKRSVELDLKTEAGLAALYDLAEEADVFIQNYRPGTAERLRVADDDIREVNEDIVYCAISAFGQTGPWSQRPGYDLLVQGMSGIMSVTGEPDSDPVKVGLPQTDLITGMWAAFGIVTALYRRALTGEGDSLELGMLDATLPWLTKQAGQVFVGEEPERMGTRDPVLAPYQTFETADGHLNVACLNQKLWRAFCETIDRPELADDERFETNADRVEHMDALEAELQAELEQRTTEEWMEILVEDAGIPAGPVYSVEEALHNEQTEARGMVTEMDARGKTIPVVEHPLNYERAETGFESPPPELGEHNREVFAELGYSDAEIDALADAGVFGSD